MPLRICKSFTFNSSHQIHHHKGKCKNLHGHTYKLEVVIKGTLHTEGPNEGFIIDFSDLKDIVEANIIAPYDHQHLNTFFPIPTAELMVKAFYDVIVQELVRRGDSCQVERVRLWETPTSWAEITCD